jgi:hypothetical protein
VEWLCKKRALDGESKARLTGRDDWIRTSDLTHPKRARYQAAPHPVNEALSMSGNRILSNDEGRKARRTENCGLTMPNRDRPIPRPQAIHVTEPPDP